MVFMYKDHNHTVIWEKTHAGSLGHTCRQSRTLFRLLTTPRFLDRSWRNLVQTICRGQRGSLWCQNIEIRNGCHGNLQMRTLRPCFARKDWDFMARPPENLNQMDQQNFWLSWNFLILACFHGNSKKWVLGFLKLQTVVHIREGGKNQILHG